MTLPLRKVRLKLVVILHSIRGCSPVVLAAGYESLIYLHDFTKTADLARVVRQVPLAHVAKSLKDKAARFS